MGIKTVNAFILIVYCYNSTSSGNIDVLAPIETCFPILTKKLHIKHTGSKHCAFRSFCPDYIELTWPTPNCQPWGHSECHKTTKHCLDHLSISACTDNFQNLLLKLPSLQVSTLLDYGIGKPQIECKATSVTTKSNIYVVCSAARKVLTLFW